MEFGKITLNAVHRQEIRDCSSPEHFVADIVIMNKQHNIPHSPLYQLKSDASGTDLESLKYDLSHSFHHGNFTFLGEVDTVDRSKKIIYLMSGNTVAYKHLIVASGIKPHMGDEEFSAAIKSLVDALKVPSNFSKELMEEMIQRSQKRSSMEAKQLTSQNLDTILQDKIHQEGDRSSSTLENTRLFDIHL